MKKARYSDEQIVRILRDADRDPVNEVAKRHGVSEQSIYGWRKRFGEFNVDEVKRLKAVEALNETGKPDQCHAQGSPLPLEQGEITPAPENIINRDFHAAITNEKWLTGITEFRISAGKVPVAVDRLL